MAGKIGHVVRAVFGKLEVKRLERKAGMKYVRKPPAVIPKGKVLVHNVAWSGQSFGEQGFRSWLSVPKPERQVPCDCDWTKLPHFRTKFHDT